jgi:pyruvate/2-oxoglutarate dehydrogenase complex dihydrolipoamide acyltransferase (E2) component
MQLVCEHAAGVLRLHAADRPAGIIATVLKRSGDAVAENETIAQVETDKVTIDIKAPTEGTILGIVVQEQDTVVPGQLVATLDDAVAKVGLTYSLL